MADAQLATVRPAKAPNLVFVCKKCGRKLGPAGKAMRKSLKHALKTRKWGKARLVTTSCFSLCPKRRQVLASARSLAEHRLLVVDETSSVEEALDYLLGPRSSSPTG